MKREDKVERKVGVKVGFRHSGSRSALPGWRDAGELVLFPVSLLVP